MQIVKVDGYSKIVPKIDFLTGIYSTKKTSQMRDPTFQHKVSVSSSVGYIVYTVVDIFTCIWYLVFTLIVNKWNPYFLFKVG